MFLSCVSSSCGCAGESRGELAAVHAGGNPLDKVHEHIPLSTLRVQQRQEGGSIHAENKVGCLRSEYAKRKGTDAGIKVPKKISKILANLMSARAERADRGN